MASVLDFGILQDFTPLFTFLLIFSLMYAFFQYAKVFGTNKSIHAMVAFVISVLASLSKNLVAVITVMTPWFVLLFFFIIFLLLGFKLFGADDALILKTMRSNDSILYWIIAFSVIILIFSVSSVFGQKLLPITTPEAGEEAPTDVEQIDANGEVRGVATTSFQVNLYSTIFHPKILGLIAILLIATFTINHLSRTSIK